MKDLTNSTKGSVNPLILLVLGLLALVTVGYFVAPGGGATAQVALMYPAGATVAIDGQPGTAYPNTNHLDMPELKGTIYQLPRGEHAVEVTLKNGAVVSGAILSDPDRFGSAVYQVYPDKGIELRK